MAQASVAITKFWNAQTHSYQTTPPTVPVGTEIAFVARMTNTSGKTQDMSLYMVIYNPDGSVCHDHTYDYPDTPGFYSGGIPWFVDANTGGWANQVGVYKADAYVYVSGTLVASVTGVTMTTATGILSAKINDWNYWDSYANAWSPTYPGPVIVGQVGVQPFVVNQGSTPIDVHFELIIYEPDGVQSTLYGAPVTLQDGGTSNPGAWAHWDFLWQGTKVGDYIVDMKLYGPNGILDTRTGIPVAYVKESPPTPAGHMTALNIKDISTGIVYDNPNHWPIDIPLNDTVQGTVKFFNDSSVPITIKLEVFWEDATGAVRASYNETPTLAVGGSKTISTKTVQLDNEGYWALHARMYLPDLPIPKTVIWNAVYAYSSLPPLTANLYVSVVDSSSLPIAGVDIALDSIYAATTGANGTCLWTGIPLGDYVIRCSKSGYQTYSKPVTLIAGDNSVSITMLPGTTANLNVYVTDSKNNPLAGVAVTADTKSGTTGTSGICSWSGIAIGTYIITCTKTGYKTETKSVALTGGDNNIIIKMLAVGEETWWDKFVASVEKYWWAYAGGGAVVVALALTRKKR